jgi:hypothetical protein
VADTVRTLAALQSLLADNTAGDISAQDVRDFLVSVFTHQSLLGYKATTDTPDDEFDESTLDAKWTAVTGSSGTVSMTETGEVEKYDLTTRPGWLLMQAGSAADQKVQLRQDFTLGDGESIILALAAVVSSDGDPGIVDNELVAGLSLNDNDTGWDAGEYNGCYVQFGTDMARVSHFDGTTRGATSAFGVSAQQVPLGMVYIRFNRVGSVLHAWTSSDGYTWMSLGQDTRVATADNVFVFVESIVNAGEPVPIVAVDWIRQGTNDLDPW